MKLTKIARELLDIREDLQMRTHGIYTDDIDEMYDFDQTWGSTALGFPGAGGSALTTARTYVIRPEYNMPYYVYFAGMFAYQVNKPNVKFMDDLRNHMMASVVGSTKYELIED